MSDGKSASINYELYRYIPSIPAAAIFAVVFAILAIAHLIVLIRNRTYFFIPFLVGLFFECGGYIARIPSHFDTTAIGPYIAQTLLILLAPPLFAASIYMTLGRVTVKLRAEKQSIVPVRILTKVFVTGDVISFLLQAGGGGYMAMGTLSAMRTGEHIVIGGLAVQLAFFSFFVFVSSVFHWRARKHPEYIAVPSYPVPSRWTRFTAGWEPIMWALYAACALILVRSIFRVIEFVQGNAGYIMRHEFLLYIFDALLMAVNGIVLVVIYPGAFLGRKRSDRDSGVDLM